MSNSEIKYIDLREEEPAGSERIKPFKSTNWYHTIRHWLIGKLAGNTMVILNAHIRVMPRADDKNILGKLAVSKGGSLVQNSNLYCTSEFMLELTNTTELKK